MDPLDDYEEHDLQLECTPSDCRFPNQHLSRSCSIRHRSDSLISTGARHHQALRSFFDYRETSSFEIPITEHGGQPYVKLTTPNLYGDNTIHTLA